MLELNLPFGNPRTRGPSFFAPQSQGEKSRVHAGDRGTHVESERDVVPALHQGELGAARAAQTHVEVVVVVRAARREEAAAVHRRHAVIKATVT